MTPHNGLTTGGAYCLGSPGREYAVYSPSQAPRDFTLDLGGTGGSFRCRFYDPRNGDFRQAFDRPGGSVASFRKPSADDWALHVSSTTSDDGMGCRASSTTCEG